MRILFRNLHLCGPIYRRRHVLLRGDLHLRRWLQVRCVVQVPELNYEDARS